MKERKRAATANACSRPTFMTRRRQTSLIVMMMMAVPIFCTLLLLSPLPSDNLKTISFISSPFLCLLSFHKYILFPFCLSVTDSLIYDCLGPIIFSDEFNKKPRNGTTEDESIIIVNKCVEGRNVFHFSLNLILHPISSLIISFELHFGQNYRVQLKTWQSQTHKQANKQWLPLLLSIFARPSFILNE